MGRPGSDDEPVFQPHRPSTGSGQRVQTHSYPVHEDHEDRGWKGEEKCPDYAMNEVLDILLERGRQYQSEIAEELAARQDLKLSTAHAYTSATLLHFRKIGFVRMVELDKTGVGRPKPIWEAVE